MRIHHIAIWTKDIESMKNFYVRYFGCRAGKKYINSVKQFESYFLEFTDGTKIELMHCPDVTDNKVSSAARNRGYIHIALSVDNKDQVDSLTDTLRNDGFKVVSEPRVTGDGYYESCILDPESNMIEITV